MKNRVNETRSDGKMVIIARGVRALAMAIALNAFTTGAGSSEDLSALRQKALADVGPVFLNKRVSIEANLVSSEGPEWWQKVFGTKVFGCPANPVTEPSQKLSLNFITGKAGRWAGSLDGINTAITKSTGAIGGGLAVPSNSSGRLPEVQSGPEFDFSFDGTQDVRRALVDVVAEQIDKCVSKLPLGSYKGDEISRLCPAPEVTRSQQKQTCVPVVTGSIGEQLADGSGYKVNVNQQTRCDFVGYGRSGDSNTGFTSCFSQHYEGVAKIEDGQQSAKTSALRASARQALNDCGKRGRKRDSGRIAQCVHKSMMNRITR